MKKQLPHPIFSLENHTFKNPAWDELDCLGGKAGCTGSAQAVAQLFSSLFDWSAQADVAQESPSPFGRQSYNFSKSRCFKEGCIENVLVFTKLTSVKNSKGKTNQLVK